MTVKIGQYWRRSNGIIYVVVGERGDTIRDVQLKPVVTPFGLKGRTTWKWDKAVEREFERAY